MVASWLCVSVWIRAIENFDRQHPTISFGAKNSRIHNSIINFRSRSVIERIWNEYRYFFAINWHDEFITNVAHAILIDDDRVSTTNEMINASIFADDFMNDCTNNNVANDLMLFLYNLQMQFWCCCHGWINDLNFDSPSNNSMGLHCEWMWIMSLCFVDAMLTFKSMRWNVQPCDWFVPTHSQINKNQFISLTFENLS